MPSTNISNSLSSYNSHALFEKPAITDKLIQARDSNVSHVSDKSEWMADHIEEDPDSGSLRSDGKVGLLMKYCLLVCEKLGLISIQNL